MKSIPLNTGTVNFKNRASIGRKIFLLGILCCLFSCKDAKTETTEVKPSTDSGTVNVDLKKYIDDCEAQLEIAVPKLTDLTKHPRLIDTDSTEWKQVPNHRLIWTSGFYPGILWYMYEITGNQKWKDEAIKRTEVFEDFKTIT